MRSYYLRAAIAAILIAVLVCFQTVLSRQDQADQQISQDLTTIDYEISDYASSNSKMPTSLSDLNLSAELMARAKQNGYEYSSKSKTVSTELLRGNNIIDNSYYRYYEVKLCAVFQTTVEKDKSDSYSSGDNIQSIDPYQHSSGRNCFTRTQMIRY